MGGRGYVGERSRACFLCVDDGMGCVMCPIWTPHDWPSGPSEAQHEATDALGCLLHTTWEGRGQGRAQPKAGHLRP
jgi:hypothetical protein